MPEHMQLFFQENISAENFELHGEEARHLVKVLRKSPGDVVRFTDGKGSIFTCRIEELRVKGIKLAVLDSTSFPRDRHYIHLAIAPTKNQERMEWMVEKITEIGFHEITFLHSEYTEKTYLKPERLEKKIIAACKQSLKSWKPQVNNSRRFGELIADPSFDSFEKFIGYVDGENQVHLQDQAQKDSSYLVLIGPEGDFTPEEIRLAVSRKFKPCSLGPSRLRTETAGLVAVHTLNLINR